MKKSNKDTHFLKKAIELADEKSKKGNYGPFGALIVKDDQIVSKGWNRVVEDHDPSAHAEITAIREAGEVLVTNDLNGCTLYSSCEPCPMCFSAILWARIDKVVYAATRQDAANAGFDDDKIYREIKKKWKNREIASFRIKLQEAQEVFQKWIDNPDKKTY